METDEPEGALLLGVRREDFDIRSAAARLLPGVVPCWVLRGGCVGTGLLWEQRHFHAALGVDGENARKREQRDGARDKLTLWFDLPQAAWSRPTDSNQAPATVLVSSSHSGIAPRPPFRRLLAGGHTLRRYHGNK